MNKLKSVVLLIIFLTLSVNTALAGSPNYEQTVSPLSQALFISSGLKEVVVKAPNQFPKQVRTLGSLAYLGATTYRRRQISAKYSLTDTIKSSIMVGRYEINCNITFPFNTK